MEKAPVYETGECRFDPCRRRSARRSSVAARRAVRASGPCSSASQSTSPVRTRSWVRVPPRAPSWKRSGQMRGLSRKQVGVARPLWVRVPPLPLPRTAAVVQRTRRRALNPEAGVRLPVAVLDARSSNRKDVGLLLRLWGFESSSGSASPGGRGSRHAAATASRGESPSRASMSIRAHGSQTCGRRPTARMRARHARDAGSTPAGHTTPTTTRRG